MLDIFVFIVEKYIHFIVKKTVHYMVNNTMYYIVKKMIIYFIVLKTMYFIVKMTMYIIVKKTMSYIVLKTCITSYFALHIVLSTLGLEWGASELWTLKRVSPLEMKIRLFKDKMLTGIFAACMSCNFTR